MPQPSEAQRSIALAGQSVSYALCRGKRRTIGLTIDHRGLRVGAPQRARLSDIEAMLQQHADWVLEKLGKWQERQQQASFEIIDGARLPWLGGDLHLQLLESGRRGQWSADGWALTLCPRPGQALPALLERALRERARQIFAGRLARFAAVLEVPPPPLSLSSARTRWGSCNSRGEIRLNWRLGFFSLPVIDYVVAHELAHLKEMNHSPRFWSVVESLCPDWRVRRTELRQQAANLPIF